MVYFDKFSCIDSDNAYFVGANTCDGFKGDFPTLVSEKECKKVFIIKGGSGTGKSTMMRRAAKACEDIGASVTYLLCSSDPDSLDGVIIEKSDVKIAIVDGTAPHTLDPVLAGACGEIVNSGDCWNTEHLEANVCEIAGIVERKKECYNSAYSYISAAGEVYKMMNSLSLRVLMHDKMSACVRRLAAQFCSEGSRPGKLKKRRTYAISMKGAARLSVFEGVENVISIEDCAGITPVFMKKAADEFLYRGCDVTVSVSPFGDIWEVLVPECGLALVPLRDDAGYCKNINLRRFINKEEMQKTRQKRRFAAKCFDTMLDGALADLRCAWTLHSELEKIYVGAMDFKALDAMTEKLSARLLAYLKI